MNETTPFEEIQESKDRSWTLRLVAMISSGELTDLKKVSRTLSYLDDPRALPILTSILEDRQNSLEVREAASDVLCSCLTLDTSEIRRGWWFSGDPILMRHAIRNAERSEKELIAAIASDPEDENHINAISTLAHWEEPTYQRLLIAALNHSDASVREAAADALLWEQPVAAEKRLLEISQESDEEAAIAALNTLCYCASKEIILTLDELRKNGQESIRSEYENAFFHVREEFASTISKNWRTEAAKKRFLAWLEPLANCVSANENVECRLDDEDLANETPPSSAPPQNAKVNSTSNSFSVEQIIEDLSQLDAKWNEKLRRYAHIEHWKDMETSDRNRLSKFLSSSNDPLVREIAAGACPIWNDWQTMLVLLHDPLVFIRKTASYYSRDLEPNQLIAERLWEVFQDDATTGCFATESLQSYLIHARDINEEVLLFDLARNDPRPSVRLESIYQLHNLKAGDAITQLKPILLEPPSNTWSVHIALLDALTDLCIEIPSLEHLRNVDNLYLQEAIAEALEK